MCMFTLESNYHLPPLLAARVLSRKFLLGGNVYGLYGRNAKILQRVHGEMYYFISKCTFRVLVVAKLTTREKVSVH